MNTTLNKIRSHAPCANGWYKLLKSLNKTSADDEPISIIKVLDSNGLDDALWCLRAVEGHDKEIRLFAVWCARQVQHLMTDPRSLAALDVAERFANGQATDKELTMARDAAWDAARDASWDASWDTSWAAVSAAVSAPSRAAVSAAAWAAASAAASAPSGAAARATARDAQERRLREICKQQKGAEQ